MNIVDLRFRLMRSDRDEIETSLRAGSNNFLSRYHCFEGRVVIGHLMR